MIRARRLSTHPRAHMSISASAYSFCRVAWRVIDLAVSLSRVMRFQIGSATLGTGKPLFPRRVLSPGLRLVSVRQMGTGMAELRYEVCGAGQDGDT